MKYLLEDGTTISADDIIDQILQRDTSMTVKRDGFQGVWSQDSYLVNRVIQRSIDTWAYVGPKSNGIMKLSEIIKLIADAPEELHLVRSSSWSDWVEWNRSSLVYSLVSQRYPNSLYPALENRPSLGPIPRATSIEFGQFIPFKRSKITITPWYIARYIRGINNTEAKQWVEALQNLFLAEGQSFFWPDLGTFYLKKIPATKRYSPASKTIKIIAEHTRLALRWAPKTRHHFRNDLQAIVDGTLVLGEKEPLRLVMRWVSQETPLSRRRQLCVQLAEKSNLSVAKSVACLHILNLQLIRYLAMGTKVGVEDLFTVHCNDRRIFCRDLRKPVS